MIGLIRKLFWFVLFLVFTLGFVTLFEHGWRGPDAFLKDCQTEFDSAMKLIKTPVPRKADQSDAAAR